MTIQSFMFRVMAARNDEKRDAAIPLPPGVQCFRDISYGKYGKESLLDVYCPEGTGSPLPTIVSLHGGGYVYGSKEIYRRYCMDLARRGFTVVNFNYRLAPRHRFPAPLEDTNTVMTWLCDNAKSYHMDPNRLFVVGDSAGAQLASQYAAIWQNPEYAALFDFRVPPINIRAVGLNCGVYDAANMCKFPRKGLAKDYLGKVIPAEDPRLAVLDAIDDRFPPAHITTACHDFLRENAQPMQNFLQSKGIPCELKCYGTEAQREIAHVFHVNIALPEATQCNDDQCGFFRRYL